MSDTRVAIASQWRDYFEAQLRFAQQLAELKDLDYRHSITFHTTLHRRFGFGRIIDGRVADGWRRYVERLAVLETIDAQVAWTQRFYIDAAAERPPEGERQFGCFGYDRPDERGQIRIHFGNLDSGDGCGPLHHTKIERRRAELKSMFTHVRKNHGDAIGVLGKSWLYHLPAYRRLFPDNYGESSALLTSGHSFDGLSSWGQFLDHAGHVKIAVRDAFLKNLPELDADHPYRVFPYPVLKAEAAIADFYEMYEVDVA